MNIVTNIAVWQSIRKTLSNKTIGFIPTMGNIHDGHLSLCERSKNEKVQVVNLNNGERLETYAIKGKAGSRVFSLNGAAARKAEIGDKIFIICYAMIDESQRLEPIVIDLEH